MEIPMRPGTRQIGVSLIILSMLGLGMVGCDEGVEQLYEQLPDEILQGATGDTSAEQGAATEGSDTDAGEGSGATAKDINQCAWALDYLPDGASVVTCVSSETEIKHTIDFLRQFSSTLATNPDSIEAATQFGQIADLLQKVTSSGITRFALGIQELSSAAAQAENGRAVGPVAVTAGKSGNARVATVESDDGTTMRIVGTFFGPISPEQLLTSTLPDLHLAITGEQLAPIAPTTDNRGDGAPRFSTTIGDYIFTSSAVGEGIVQLVATSNENLLDLSLVPAFSTLAEAKHLRECKGQLGFLAPFPLSFSLFERLELPTAYNDTLMGLCLDVTPKQFGISIHGTTTAGSILDAEVRLHRKLWERIATKLSETDEDDDNEKMGTDYGKYPPTEFLATVDNVTLKCTASEDTLISITLPNYAIVGDVPQCPLFVSLEFNFSDEIDATTIEGNLVLDHYVPNTPATEGEGGHSADWPHVDVRYYFPYTTEEGAPDYTRIRFQGIDGVPGAPSTLFTSAHVPLVLGPGSYRVMLDSGQFGLRFTPGSQLENNPHEYRFTIPLPPEATAAGGS